MVHIRQMETKTLYHKRRWDAFAREWVYPENANKQFIKDLKASVDFDDEDKAFIDKLAGKELTDES